MKSNYDEIQKLTSSLIPKQPKQTQEENTIAKRIGKSREYTSNAVIIGLSNILGIDLTIGFSPVQNGKEFILGYNLIVSKCSIFNDLPQPGGSDSRQSKRNRECVIYNYLSQYIQQQMKEVVELMNGNCDELSFPQLKRRKTLKTEKLNVYKAFEPFNEKGFSQFGKKVIDIVVNHETKHEATKKHTFVTLQGRDFGICSMFSELIQNDELLSNLGQLIRLYFFPPIETIQNNKNIEINENIQNETTKTNEMKQDKNETIDKNNLFLQIIQTNQLQLNHYLQQLNDQISQFKQLQMNNQSNNEK